MWFKIIVNAVLIVAVVAAATKRSNVLFLLGKLTQITIKTSKVKIVNLFSRRCRI
jgi:predicted regulator of Ras-like GTPase activity (Roadblock/LC7/MglB family)